MRKYQIFARTAVCAAALGMLLPGGAAQAGELPAASQSQSARDVVLTGGALQGQYLTSTGAPVDGAEVIVRQGRNEIARVITDSRGLFRVDGVKKGFYQVTAGGNMELLRVWEEDAAPPNAQRYATLVNSAAVRGQGTGSNAIAWTALGLGIAGTATGIAALANSGDSETYNVIIVDGE